MIRDEFIRKYLGNKDYQYDEHNRDLMRDDLDMVIEYANQKQVSDEEIKYVIELSDWELKIVTHYELMKMKDDAMKFDGFESWIVKGKLT